MSEQYTRELLRVAVAQICQTIGYNATQTSSLEILQDLLHRFLNEFARDLHLQVEHHNRTAACLEDVKITLSSLNINIQDLLDYIANVEPVQFLFEVPKFPVNKPSNLNFLKPGSKEVLSRPVHIFEHLPPMLPPDVLSSYSNEIPQNKAKVGFGIAVESNQAASTEDKSIMPPQAISLSNVKNEFENDRSMADLNNIPISSSMSSVPAIASKALQINELGKPTREIMSVVMTSGGFISPAIEGKLPESGIPNIVEKFFGLDAPPSSPTSPPPTESVPTFDIPTTKCEKNVSEANAKCSTPKDVTVNAIKRNVMNRGGGANITTDENPKEIAATTKMNLLMPNVMKKSGLVQSSPTAQQPPLVALKLLKKAKKKGMSLLTNPTESLEGNLGDILLQNSDKISEKARRKKLKTLQKMLKNAQKHQSGGIDLKKEAKKMKSLLNVNTSNEGIVERVRMEKMLKKQAKQKQKQLKKRVTTLSAQKEQISSSDPAQQSQTHFSTETPVRLMECGAAQQPLVDEMRCGDTKQSISKLGAQPLPHNYEKETATTMQNKLHTQIENSCLVNGPHSSDSQSNILPMEKASALEIKLSNEPDRNKLNILKKISKAQKGAAQLLTPIPPKPSVSSSSNTFTGSEGQIINLPSGTTITPAPLEFSSSVAQKFNFQDGVLDCSTTQFGPFDLSTASAQSEVIANKPKKRGRKPGSKNQPKLPPPPPPPFGSVNQEKNLNAPGIKKQKKKAIKLDLMQDSILHHSAAPGNLTALGQAPFPNAAAPSQISPPTPATLLKTQRKDRKEKEKPKIIVGEGAEAQQFENTSLMNMSGGSPFGHHLNMLFANNLEQQNIAPPQNKQRKRSSNQEKNSNPPPPAAMLPAFLSGAHQTGSTGFPNLTSNMLSMLPFAFPPRPGLIPTSGLFPPGTGTGLPNFANQILNPASTAAAGNAPSLLGLAPHFFPFSTMKPPPTNLPPHDRTSRDRPKELPTSGHPFAKDRSYCNVAPLVPPESMQQVADNTAESTSYPSSLSTGKHSIKDSLHNMPKPEGSGGAAMPIDFCNKNMRHTFISNTPELGGVAGTSLVHQSADNSASINAMKAHANERHMPTGGADDPIEVSDDSDETTMRSNNAAARGNFDEVPPPPTQFTQLAKPKLEMSHETAEKLDANAKITDTTQETDAKLLSSPDVKKLKKLQKHLKKNVVKTAEGSGNDGFSSKLAGGADLIPLTGTGMSYSAKTIPSTSLTAASKQLNLSTYEQANVRQFCGEPDKIYNDVSIIPNIQKKKNKEHKKLRKIREGDSREGKIKKKKEKKDKTKNKEHMKLVLLQGAAAAGGLEKQGEKDALKRLKKEKKKLKQRLLANPNDQYQGLVLDNHPNISNTKVPLNIGGGMQATSTPSTPSTVLTIPAVQQPPTVTDSSSLSSVVPKLTLKLGSSLSPTPTTTSMKRDESSTTTTPTKREPSPELARFSPLVTRPPKQKISQNDSQMTYLTNQPSPDNKSSTLIVKPTESILALPSHHSSVIPPPSPWLSGGTLTASSVLLPQQLTTTSSQQAKPAKVEERLHPSKVDTSSDSTTIAPQSTQNALTTSNEHHPVSLITEINRPSSYVDAEGNTVWICPACGKVDDGSPMIGCDGCDAWYHWECVGISVAPNDKEDWFCRVCITRKKGFQSGGADAGDKKRKRNKKK